MYNASAILTKLIINRNIHLSFRVFIKIFYDIIFGPAWYHLWFLYLIIGLYILMPLLQVFVHAISKEGLEICILLFLCGVTLNLTNLILNAFKLKEFFFPIPEISGYVGYLLAGCYFATYDLSKKIKTLIYMLGSTSLVITFVGTFVLSSCFGESNECLYEYLSINCTLMSFMVFLFIKEKFKDKTFSLKKEQFIIKLSNLTFGIYLVHDLFLQIFRLLNIKLALVLLDVPIKTIFTFVISTLLVYVISKIRFLNGKII
nr:acyltransferase family protein [Treponema phagedenis]